MRSHWTIRVLLIMTLAGGMLGLCLVPGLRPRDFLVRWWEQRLEKLGDEEALPQLRELAGLGDAALPLLADALTSSHPPLAEAAATVLHEEMVAWRLLPPPQSSPKVARLAELLAERANLMSSTGKGAAARLALQILVWPIDRTAADAPSLIANCHRVLDLTDRSAAIPSVMAGAEEEELLAGDMSADPENPPALPPPPEDDRDDRLASSTPAPATLHIDDQPSPLTVPRPDEAPLEPPLANASPRDPAGTDPGLLPRDQQPAPIQELAPSAGMPRPVDARPLSDIDLMRALHHDDPRWISAAADELGRRGFTETHLQLAAQLVHPDPAIRRQLAVNLSQLTHIDGRPWLLWLSGDQDRTVRREAFTAMAISGDFRMHARLQELETQETDPELLAYLRRLLKLRP